MFPARHTRYVLIILDGGTGQIHNPMPDRMSVPMMRRLLGGEFPYANGFDWEAVSHFKFEDGHWEPYNAYGEILPVAGFSVEATLDAEFFEFAKSS